MNVTSNARFTISRYDGLSDIWPIRQELTLTELERLLSAYETTDVKAGPLWSSASIREGDTAVPRTLSRSTCWSARWTTAQQQPLTASSQRSKRGAWPPSLTPPIPTVAAQRAYVAQAMVIGESC